MWMSADGSGGIGPNDENQVRAGEVRQLDRLALSVLIALPTPLLPMVASQ